MQAIYFIKKNKKKIEKVCLAQYYLFKDLQFSAVTVNLAFLLLNLVFHCQFWH